MIRSDEWLQDAKRLPVGHTARVYHGAERRPNMVVRNLVDRYVCWCHSCNDGAVIKKDVVKLVKEAPQMRDHRPKDPGSLRPLNTLTLNQLGEVLAFLHSKDMHLDLIKDMNPALSIKDTRLVFTTPDQVVGRDLTGQSKAKWYTYTQVHSFNRAAFEVFKDKTCIITEDYFSALKGQYYCKALERNDILFVASMGTVLHPDLLLELVKAKQTVMMYDNDEAGIKGANAALKTLGLLGCRSHGIYPDLGKDPKNMQVQWFETVLKGL